MIKSHRTDDHVVHPHKTRSKSNEILLASSREVRSREREKSTHRDKSPFFKKINELLDRKKEEVDSE